MDQSDIDDLKRQDRAAKRYTRACINHPNSNDPDSPEWCYDCQEHIDDCECEEE
jgi:hypothetical protein